MPSDRTAVPALPPASPYPVMQRVDPSPDVQQRVASAIEACTQWQPQAVQPAKGAANPPQLSTEAQVCDLLDRWPLLYNGEELQVASVGVGFALAAAMACIAAWVVFRGVLGIVPLAPLASRLLARAVGGALCGVGLATFSLLLGLQRFAAATLEETANKALLSWQITASWAAAVMAVLFMLFDVPNVWRRRTSRTATR